MIDWAEKEITAVCKEITATCKKQNPDWDDKSFDYKCNCYQSALKVYKSLLGDNCNEYTFNITKNILKKLLDNIPLMPITDKDFFDDDKELEPADSIRKRGFKSARQCSRRSSLFRDEYLDGTVKYYDIERTYVVDAEHPNNTFKSIVCLDNNFIDELYPITMPYIPSPTPFKVYVKYWSTDMKHGDYDIDMIIGYEDQKGQWHDYKKCTYYSYNDRETHEVNKSIL